MSDRDLTGPAYKEYLCSPQWECVRREAMEAADYCCEGCGMPSGEGHELHVHHKTYERLGNEHPADVEVLCESCHEQAHGIKRDMGIPGIVHWRCLCGELNGSMNWKCWKCRADHVPANVQMAERGRAA